MYMCLYSQCMFEIEYCKVSLHNIIFAFVRLTTKAEFECMKLVCPSTLCVLFAQVTYSDDDITLSIYYIIYFSVQTTDGFISYML